ncbi:MAG: hypothetical protein ACRCWR_12180 [Saezia sp.]
MASNKLEMLFAAINGGQEDAILTGKDDLYPYENGKRGDTKIGTKWQVVLQGNRFSSLTVKIEGPDPLPKVTDSQIAESCATLNLMYVRFTDCKITVYAIDGMVMTATAKSVSLVAE